MRRLGAPKSPIMGRSASKPKLVEGSKRALCASCRKHFVWVTPAMVFYGMKVVCIKCAPPQRKQ